MRLHPAPTGTPASSPYDPRPAMVAGWPSAVALFARSTLALGSSRAAAWVDSGTGEGGTQRLVGRPLAPLDADAVALLAHFSVSSSPRSPQDADVRNNPLLLSATDPHPATASAAVWGTEIGDAGISTFAEQAPRDGEEWVHLAVSEAEGKLAVMSADGKVHVREYAPLE
jgi:hypothetical protein